MKIKSDFVTNSSSTAFIVMIPNNFHTSEDEMKNFYDNSSDDEIELKQLFEELPDCLESLKEGDNVWHYGRDGLHFTIYNIILDLCYEHKFILSSLEMNGEGNNIIQGVKEKDIENILINNMDIICMFKSIQRNDENDTSKRRNE
jgi:hypothetical protein